MTSRPFDTAPDADRVQIALLRAASPARRAAMAFRLSRWVATLSRRALRARHPEIDEREAALRHLELDHGADLARRVRARLAESP